jgi:hypothetical protein
MLFLHFSYFCDSSKKKILIFVVGSWSGGILASLHRIGPLGCGCASVDNCTCLSLLGLVMEQCMHAWRDTHIHKCQGNVLELTKLGLRQVISEGKRNGCFTFRPNFYNSISLQVWSSRRSVGKLKAKAAKCRCASLARDAQQEDGEEEDFQVLAALRSSFNDIVIVDTPSSRMLLLDSTRMLSLSLSLAHTRRALLSSDPAIYMGFTLLMHADNVHSILYKDRKWTGSYWVCQLLY